MLILQKRRPHVELVGVDPDVASGGLIEVIVTRKSDLNLDVDVKLSRNAEVILRMYLSSEMMRFIGCL